MSKLNLALSPRSFRSSLKMQLLNNPQIDVFQKIMRYLLLTVVSSLLIFQSLYANQGNQKANIVGVTVDEYRSECSRKHADSCYGIALEISRDLRHASRTPNEEEAMSLFKYYKLACEYGNTDGCYTVARSYLDGSLFIKKDIDRGLSGLEKACNNKYVRACSDLADLYLRGTGVTKNPSKAVEYYRKGCELNDALMCGSAAHAYTVSQGVERDMRESIKYLDKTCKLGFQAACLDLAEFYRDGEYVEQNVETAVDYFKLGCEDNESGRCIAARKYIESIVNDVRIDSFANISEEISAVFSQATICSSNYKPSSYSDDCDVGYNSDNKKIHSGKLFFFARGYEFISLNQESLIIDSLKIDGVDARRDSEGGENFTLGGLMNQKDDQGNDYLSWSIKVHEGLSPMNSTLELQGSVIAIKGQNFTELESNIFSASDFKSFQIGPVFIRGNEFSDLRYGLEQVSKKFPDFSVRVVDILEQLIKSKGADIHKLRLDITQTEINLLDISDKEKESVMNLKQAYEGWSQRWSGGSMLDEEYGKFFLQIDAGSRLVKKVVLLQNDEEIGVSEASQAEFSEAGDSSVHYFDKPNTDEVKLKVVYWDEPENVKINFSIEP